MIVIRLRNEKQEKEFFRIDLAPMINIVFLLLIFFLLTSTAIKQGNVIQLPQAKTSETNKEKSVVISLNEDRQLQLDHSDVTLATLQDNLQSLLEIRKKKVVTIEGDRKIDFKLVGDIMEIAQQAGAVDFILATESMDE